ncbi:MAG: hypothetical protein J5982_03270 [Bacilli bacterium]|nr:hypothetical protein [Bacilli bacterium]
MAQRIKIRRDTKENWSKYNPVLSLGEFGYETDTKQLKIGDGETAYNSLSYYRGFFTDAMQTKLNGIAAGAEKNTIKSISVKSTTTNVPVAADSNGNVNIDISGKVDKEKGKGLSTNDYTTEEKNKLAGIDESKLIQKVLVNGIPQTIIDKTVNIKVENHTVYGIKRRITGNSSSKWERTDDAVGLEANAQVGSTAVKNDFDNIYPWSGIISYNYNTTTHQRVADYGDPNFKFDGSNGEVFTYYPEFYWTHYFEATDQYIDEYIKLSEYAINGYNISPAFSTGRYESSYDGSKLHSKSGTFPEVSQNITTFRNRSRALGEGFGQLDYHYFLMQLLYLVEYADYNSQAVLGNGEIGYRVSDADKALVAENGVNRIVVSTSVANYFDVGQYIGIGSNSAWNNNIASNRKILSKESYSVGSVNGTAINFDGAAVNITTTSVIHSVAQPSGKCDFLGMKSGTLNKSNRNAIIYRGVENIFGNIWKFIDGVNIKDYEAYVCYDPTQYKSDTFTGAYKKLSYSLVRPAAGATNTATEGYSKTLGYDPENPLFSFATEVGGSSSTYMCDYTWINSGNRILLAGGCYDYSMIAGLWASGLNAASGNTGINIGSRLLLNQN